MRAAGLSVSLLPGQRGQESQQPGHCQQVSGWLLGLGGVVEACNAKPPGGESCNRTTGELHMGRLRAVQQIWS